MKNTLQVCAVALASALVHTPPPSAAALPGGGGGGYTYTSPCILYPPTVDDCQDPTWLQSACGAMEQQTLDDAPATALCANLCTGLSPTVDQCEDDAWMSSACGQLESPRWLAWHAGQQEADTHGFVQGEFEPGDLDDLFDDSQCAQATENAAPVTDPAEVVLPDGVADPDADGRAQVEQQRYGRDGQAFIGGSSSYLGHTMREWTRASSDAPGAEVESSGGFVWTPAMTDGLARLAWEQNGVAVDTCREYVYERYYDYSQFEDAIMTLGHDYRAIFDVAYTTPPRARNAAKRGTRDTAPDPSRAPRSAIGTRGAAGLPQTARDGTAIEPQIAFPATPRAKNAFYEIGLIDAQTRADALADYATAQQANDVARFQGSCGSTLAGPVFCDTTLYDDLVDGSQVTYVESWAWHQQMSDDLQAAGYLDEELAAFEQRVEAFELLMRQRSDVVRRIVLWWKGKNLDDQAQMPVEVADALFDPAVGMQLMAGDPLTALLTTQSQARLNLADIGGMGALTVPAPPTLEGFEGQVQMAWQAPAPTAEAWVAAAPDATRALASTANIHGQDYLDGLHLRLHRIDAAIEQALLDARAAGCIDADQTSPCDWSPRLFAQRVVGLYGTQREADHGHCLDNTPEGFGKLAGHDLSIPTFDDSGAGEWTDGRQWPRVAVDGVTTACFLDAGGAVTEQVTTDCVGCNQWSASTSKAALYFRCLEAHKQLILKAITQELGQDAITADGNLKLQASSGDTTRLGDDNFNITTSYGFGWSLGDFSTYATATDGDGDPTLDRCVLTPEAYAHFDVDATALFFQQSLVHASAHARLGDVPVDDPLVLPAGVQPNRIEVELVGIDIIEADTQIDLAWNNTFNIVKDEWSEGGTMVSAGATFTIVFVPVSIRGGVAGEIGIGYAIDAEVPVGEQESCAFFRLTGNVTPFASVDAFATATIDVLIAEAGLKVSLTLLRIDLPFDVTLSLGVEDGELALTFSSNLDLVVSFLSGRISAYLRVLWEEFEATLFAWDGPRLTVQLLDVGVTMPLVSMEMAARAVQTLGDSL